jgi:hypothetical protein
MIGRRLETKEHFDWLIDLRVTHIFFCLESSFAFLSSPELLIAYTSHPNLHR